MPQECSWKSMSCFIDSLNIDVAEKVKIYPSKSTFKFEGGRILTSLYHIEVPILLAYETVIIDFDVVESDLPLLLGKQTMKKWDLNINMGNDTAHFIINNKKNVELYTSASRHWCINIQPCLPTDSVPLDGTHLDAVSGLIELGFALVPQRGELN